MELVILLWGIAMKVSPWTIPKDYKVCIMAARILAASPLVVATVEDLNLPPVVRWF